MNMKNEGSAAAKQKNVSMKSGGGTGSENFAEIWRKQCSRVGRICIPIILLSMFGPVVYLKLVYGVFPEWSVALSAWATVAAAFGTYYIIEPLSYYPILGITGTYMAFTCGSIADIRMPASATAQEVTGVEFGSDEGSVISTIGVAGSVVTSLIVVFVTAVAGTTIISLLPDALVEGLKLYTVPSVFGAVYVQFCKFEPKLSWLILVTTVIFFLLKDIYGLMMITSVIVSVLIARILYKKGFFGEVEK